MRTMATVIEDWNDGLMTVNEVLKFIGVELSWQETTDEQFKVTAFWLDCARDFGLDDEMTVEAWQAMHKLLPTPKDSPALNAAFTAWQEQGIELDRLVAAEATAKEAHKRAVSRNLPTQDACWEAFMEAKIAWREAAKENDRLYRVYQALKGIYLAPTMRRL